MKNNSGIKFYLEDPNSTENSIFAALYTIVVIIGIIGNSFVIAVVRKNKSMQTTTNILLVNLAVGDIVTLLWCPRLYSFSLLRHHPSGLVGDYLCKLFTGNAVVGVAITSSILTLTILALERYHALVKPMDIRRRLNREDIGKAIGFLWVMAFLTRIPDFVGNIYSNIYKKCICPFSLEFVKQNDIHVICTVVFLGVLPFLVISFCYVEIIKGIYFSNTVMPEQPGFRENNAKSRKKLARLLVSITAAFYICYLPYGAFWFYMVSVEEKVIVRFQAELSSVLKATELLVVCSSSLNPILYAFQSSNYREGFKNVCCIKFLKKTASFKTKVQTFRNEPMSTTA